MRTRLILAVSFAALAAAVWLAGLRPASGASGPQYAMLAATALTPVGYSTHNSAANHICGDFVAPSGVSDTTNGEVRGQLDNAEGSFEGFVRLPEDASVTQFSVLVNDADSDDNVHAYLIRRNVADGLDKTTGYLVMAHAASDGAVINTIRQFDDDTILGKAIDNSHYAYFVELVDCGVPESFAVRITYTTG
jgi:hypothetical protein